MMREKLRKISGLLIGMSVDDEAKWSRGHEPLEIL